MCHGRGLDMQFIKLGAGGGEGEKDVKYRKSQCKIFFQGDIKAFFHGALP